MKKVKNCCLVLTLQLAFTACHAGEATERGHLEKPIIITREQWGSRPQPIPTSREQTPRFITIHHAGIKWKSGDDPFKVVQHLQTWGQAEKHWPDVPYHFLIAPDGRIFEGRPIKYEPESNTQYDLHGHIGIELMGNFEEQRVSKAQLTSCVNLIAWLCQDFRIAPGEIGTHKDRAPGQTVCPGRDMDRYVRGGPLPGWVRRSLEGGIPEIELLDPLPAGPTTMIGPTSTNQSQGTGTHR